MKVIISASFPQNLFQDIICFPAKTVFTLPSIDIWLIFQTDVGVVLRDSEPRFVVCYWLLGLRHVVHWSCSIFSTVHCTHIDSENRKHRSTEAMRLIQSKMRLNTGTNVLESDLFFSGLGTKFPKYYADHFRASEIFFCFWVFDGFMHICV